MNHWPLDVNAVTTGATATSDEPEAQGTTHPLMGCTEDVHCQDHGRCCRPLCFKCRVPICKECIEQLFRFRGDFSTIPMAIANDHWYGYVQDLIAQYEVRWIECAAEDGTPFYHNEETHESRWVRPGGPARAAPRVTPIKQSRV